MNVFDILEAIMEALADGRKEGETTAQFRDRKAGELEQHFAEKKQKAEAEQKIATKQAENAKKEFEKKPTAEAGQKAIDASLKALEVANKGTEAGQKEYKVQKIRRKIDWRKSMSEAFEIMEEIMNAIDEDINSAIDKRYPKGSERNKELKRSATTAKMDAEEVAKEHALGKRPEPAPMKGGWDIRTWEIPAETPEEREYSKKETDYDIKQIRKEFTKNKTGEHETKKKQFPKSYKDVGVLGEPDAKELETERTVRKALGKRKAKMNKNEALEILESILSYADNLFELDYEEKQNISPNEISRVKKNKKGERVEVVSVADELFPYEGDAKQQFNQKVLAKINDMIEGTGSLEDLIQFVRAGAKAKASKAHEGYEEAIGILEDIEGQIKKRYGLNRGDAHEFGELGYNRANDLYGKVMRAKSGLEDKGQGTKHTETKNSKGEKKNEEEFYNKVANRSAQVDRLVSQIPMKSAVQKSKDRHYKKVIKDGVYSINKNESLEQALSLLEGTIRDFFLGTEKKDPATKSAVGRTLRGKEATYNKHADDAIKYSERAKGAKGYRAQVNQEKADDAERKATEANKDLRKTKGEYLDILRKDKGLSNPQAHAILKRAVGESVQEMLELVEGLFVKDNRGDLLDDIDTALGSPVKKKIKDIENRMTGCKQKKVHEALDLLEEVINELKDSTYRRSKNLAKAVSDEQEKNVDNVTKAEDLKFVKDDIAKKRHQAAVFDNKYENQVVARAEKEEEKKSKDK